jgi:hypothetical protein
MGRLSKRARAGYVFFMTRGKLGWAAVAAAALIAIAPLWMVRAPAMPDYPAHLATYHLIAVGGEAPFYRIQWAWLPNLAAEALVPLLAKLLPLEVATRLFVSIAAAMWAVGPALIHRALYGRIGAAPLFGALFAYNANFLWGFLNYYFAMGLALCVFAAWIATDGRRGPLALLGFALAATAIYFCHLFALATLGLLIAAYEARDLKRVLPRAGALALIFLPSALAFVFLKPKGGSGEGVAFDLLDTALDKIGAALQQSFDDPALVLLGLLAMLFAVGVWRGWARVNPKMILPLAAVGLAALFAPEWAMGGWAVHMRLPAVACALAFAALEFDVEPRAEMVLAVAALALFGHQAATLCDSWSVYDRQFAEFRAATEQLPVHTRLLTVLDGDAIGLDSDQPYWHMAEFAIPDRAAMTQLLFATPDQHVVRVLPPMDAFVAASANQGSPPDIDELADLAAGRIDADEDIKGVFPYLIRFQCHFDVAVVVHLGGPRALAPPTLRLRHAGSFFSLYDIVRPSDCKG